VIRKNKIKMDLDCQYFDKKNGKCESPLAKEKGYLLGCFISDHNQCPYSSTQKSNGIIKPEKESGLEGKSKN
jgi:hypothetical protein